MDIKIRKKFIEIVFLIGCVVCFHGVGAWLLVWFFPTSDFGVGIFF